MLFWVDGLLVNIMELPELNMLDDLLTRHADNVEVEPLLFCHDRSDVFPVTAIRLGSAGPHAPALLFTGGIHGLERIGTEVLLAYLETLLERLQWDTSTQSLLERINLHFIPLVNPVGMARHRRSNGNGVDLMRNAPVEGERTLPLIGGHRISPRLPWYRGQQGQLERETEVLLSYVSRHLHGRPFSMVLDCHSGFGMKDRIWFPYAGSKRHAVAHLPEFYCLRELFFKTHPNQNYIFEPQAVHYQTHGDLWDFVYDRGQQEKQVILPLTLELGSWLWVKKNPLQLRSPLGLFHPVLPHRVRRVRRHHQVFFEFLLRATLSWAQWWPDADRERYRNEAHTMWFAS